MRITQAVNRIFWRFGGNDNKRPFPVNELDVEAYNSIKNFVKKQQAIQYEKNENFAKLFIYIYMRKLEQDGSTIFDNQAREKIYKILQKPLFQVVEDFQVSLNDSEAYEFKNSLGLSKEHPAIRSEQRSEEDKEILFEACKTPDNLKRLTGEVWDYDTVKDLVEKEISQAINLFD